MVLPSKRSRCRRRIDSAVSKRPSLSANIRNSGSGGSVASDPCSRRRMSASPAPAPATGPRTGTNSDNPKLRCHGRRALQDAQGRLRVPAAERLAGDSGRTPTPGPLPLDCPPHCDSPERLSRPLAPRKLNAYVRLVREASLRSCVVVSMAPSCMHTLRQLSQSLTHNSALPLLSRPGCLGWSAAKKPAIACSACAHAR